MDVVAEVKARTDIVDLLSGYMELKKAGRYYKALSPFRQEKTPSFMISPERQFAWCFSSQEGGDVIKMVEHLEGVGFREAVKILAERAHMDLPADWGGGAKQEVKERLGDINARAAQIYAKELANTPDAQEYLAKRRLSAETIQKFQIGFAPDRFDFLHPQLSEFQPKELIDAGVAKLKEMGSSSAYDVFRGRIMFPIRDARGQVVAFTGRVVGAGEPKYLNSPESPIFKKNTVLFGLDMAKETIREKKQAVVVEGQMDVIACHQAGFTQVVASSGTALTEQHLRTLQHQADEVLLCMDADAAGKESIRRAMLTALSLDLTVRVVQLPEACKDPDEVIQQDPALLQHAFDHGLPVFAACAQYLFADLPRESATDKKKYARQMLEVAQHFASAIEREDFIRQTALYLSVSEAALAEELGRLRAPTRQSAPAPVVAEAAPAELTFGPAERVLGLLLTYSDLRELGADFSPATDDGKQLLAGGELPPELALQGEKLRLLTVEKFDSFSPQKRAEELQKLLLGLNVKTKKQRQIELRAAISSASDEGNDALEKELTAELIKLFEE